MYSILYKEKDSGGLGKGGELKVKQGGKSHLLENMKEGRKGIVSKDGTCFAEEL
jgi:hypothetical protein